MKTTEFVQPSLRNTLMLENAVKKPEEYYNYMPNRGYTGVHTTYMYFQHCFKSQPTVGRENHILPTAVCQNIV